MEQLNKEEIIEGKNDSIIQEMEKDDMIQLGDLSLSGEVKLSSNKLVNVITDLSLNSSIVFKQENIPYTKKNTIK